MCWKTTNWASDGGMHQSFLSTMQLRPSTCRTQSLDAARRTQVSATLLGGVHGSVASQTRSTLCDICSSEAWHNQGWVFVFCASTWDHPTLESVGTTLGCIEMSSSSGLLPMLWARIFARNPSINHHPLTPVLNISTGFSQQTLPP